MLETKRLKYLYETALAGSMRAASEKLDMAPSSISRQIANLERELGTDLIERKRREIRLTEAGELAVQHYREGIALSETFESELAELRGLRRGTVTLSVGEGFVGDAFFDALDDFSQRWADIKIAVDVQADTAHVLRHVLNDDAHVGLVFETPSDPRVNVRASFDQPIMALVAPGHALATRESIRMSDLAGLRLALPRKQLRIRQMIDTAAHEEAVWLDPGITSNSLLLLKRIAVAGSAVTLLPPLAAPKELDERSLVAVKVRSARMNETVANIVTRRGRRLPVAVRMMLSLLADLGRHSVQARLETVA